MSFVSNVMALSLNKRRASNAEFGRMKTTNRMMNRIRQAGNSPSFGANNLNQMHEQEKNDMSKLHTFNLMRMISNARAETAEKMAKENAKSFDYLA